MKSISEGERHSLTTIIDGVQKLSEKDKLSLICAFDKVALEEVTLLVRLITHENGSQDLIPLAVVRDSREICQRYALPNGRGGYDFAGQVFGAKQETLNPPAAAPAGGAAPEEDHTPVPEEGPASAEGSSAPAEPESQ